MDWIEQLPADLDCPVIDIDIDSNEFDFCQALSLRRPQRWTCGLRMATSKVRGLDVPLIPVSPQIEGR